jgi:ribonuclease VapC
VSQAAAEVRRSAVTPLHLSWYIAVEALVEELGVSVLPFGAAQWAIAVEAFRRYSRGRHPAALNFGDCLAYATAKASRDTLLYVGRDFARTDIKPAIP